MELGGSLPCSQEPVINLYPEPNESNPYTSDFIKIHFNILLHLRLCIPKRFISYPMRATCPTDLIPLDFTIRKYMAVTIHFRRYVMTLACILVTRQERILVFPWLCKWSNPFTIQAAGICFRPIELQFPLLFKSF